MPELEWSIVWMLVVLMVSVTICAIVLIAMMEMAKDGALQRKIKAYNEMGGGGGVRPGME